MWLAWDRGGVAGSDAHEGHQAQERSIERIDLGGTFTVEVVKDRRDSRRVELHGGEDRAVDISVWGQVGDFGKFARGERSRMEL